jgi:hypothetical protein
VSLYCNGIFLPLVQSVRHTVLLSRSYRCAAIYLPRSILQQHRTRSLFPSELDATPRNVLQHGLCGSDRSCLQQEGWTWDLARLLFEAIPGEAHAEGALLGGDSAEATGAARIASFQRRAALSHWLQVCRPNRAWGREGGNDGATHCLLSNCCTAECSTLYRARMMSRWKLGLFVKESSRSHHDAAE